LATWDVSEDGTTYTFHINEDAKWHDGEPVTAKDVVFTYKLVADGEAGAIYFDRIKALKGAQAFHDGEVEDIEGLKIIDDKTVEMTLEAPTPGFLLTSQSAMFIMPEHLLGHYDSTEVMDAPFWRNPVGCGPYKWGEYVTDEYVRYEKFPDFFLGEPKIDEIYYRIGNWETLQAAFEVGELDFVQVEWTDVERFEEMDFATLFRGPQYVDNVDLNTQHAWLDNPKFRQALMYALDREQMVEAAFLGGASIADNTFVTPWALSPNNTKYSYDPEKAKQLLEEIGWDESTTFKFLLVSGLPHYEKMALIMQQNWADVGIDIDIEKMEGAAVIETMIEGDYDMGTIGYGTMSLIPYTVVNYLGANSLPPDGANWGFYVDEEMTEMLEEVAHEADEDRRIELFYQVTERMTDRLPKLPLVVEEFIVAINTDRIHIPNPVIVPRNRPGEQTWLTWNIYEWEVIEE
jgi:peptide/nickel transport system substrate-binding protein